MAKEKAPKSVKETKPAAGPATNVIEKGVAPRLTEFYNKEIIPKLMEKFSYKSVAQVPKLDKICVNVGVGQATQDPKLIELIVKELEYIVGQKTVVRRSKKAISNFKLREGMPIGVSVTLRRHRMMEFFDRLVNVTMPRIRDFRGLSDKSFDGRGNYTLGVKEQIIFPEIDVDKVTKVFGMDITFVTTAKTDQEAYELLKAFGMPFVKPQ
ncbi:MAG: 50S ribosomal protein L5 [Bacteroidota bacterium]|nr:50S ribosomal protein L5 [Bacteroidota bacterium]